MIFAVDCGPIYTEVDPSVKTKSGFSRWKSKPGYLANRVGFSPCCTGVGLVWSLVHDSLMETPLVAEAKVDSRPDGLRGDSCLETPAISLSHTTQSKPYDSPPISTSPRSLFQLNSPVPLEIFNYHNICRMFLTVIRRTFYKLAEPNS